MRIIKGGKGGFIHLLEKGETANPNGAPKRPRKLKEFIKELENENDEIVFPAEALEVITRTVEGVEKTFYKLKDSKGSKMFLVAYNKAIKGDAKWADFLVKMGFAGGYEPAKSQVDTNDESQTKLSEAILKLAEAKNKQSK
jgi:ABC-type nitrate/sulfonate/bicarbonate transport system substrate-binding protein